MKTMIRNPFITSGYVSADYFCDRRFESEQLVREVMNGNNLALVRVAYQFISPEIARSSTHTSDDRHTTDTAD